MNFSPQDVIIFIIRIIRGEDPEGKQGQDQEEFKKKGGRHLNLQVKKISAQANSGKKMS